MQFSQTYWKLFGGIAEFFTQNPRNQWADNFFRKNMNPHCSFGIKKGSFDNSAGKGSPGVWQVFAQTPKKCRLHAFGKCVPQKRSSASKEWVFHFRGKNMLLSGQKVFAQCPKERKIRTFPRQHFFSKLIPTTDRKHVYFTPTDVFSKLPKKSKKS